MNLERIERALRDGPVDEPRYVPGAFGSARRTEPLLWAAAVAGALVLGIVIGLGIGLLRAPSPNVGGPSINSALIQEQLEGTWLSEPVTQDEFVRFMLDNGHSQADLDDEWHEPIDTTLRWGLDFDGRGRLVIFTVTGDGVTEIVAEGPYELLPDGRLRWTDITCVTIANFDVSADQLSFEDRESQNCDTQERIAHDAFFGLSSPYAFSAR